MDLISSGFTVVKVILNVLLMTPLHPAVGALAESSTGEHLPISHTKEFADSFQHELFLRS